MAKVERSRAIRRQAARASRVASVRRLELDQAFDIWSCMPTIMRRITERTVVAAMSSMRVKAALLRSVSVNLAELRRVFM